MTSAVTSIQVILFNLLEVKQMWVAIALSIFSIPTNGQQVAPTIEWQKTIGGESVDSIKSVRQTTDGGYIVGGTTRSFNNNTHGLADYWIVKIDSLGSIIWQKTIGGSSEDILAGVEETTDGGFIVGGTSASNVSGDKTEPSKGSNDFWVLKLRSDGSIIWQKTIGGYGNEVLWSIEQNTEGGYILGGNSNSNISGNKSENSHGGNDYWVIKLDSNGTILWDKTLGGNREEGISEVHQTADGGYIVGGDSNSRVSGDKSDDRRNPNGEPYWGIFLYRDYWIVKLDSNGFKQWDKTIGGEFHDYLYSIQQCSDKGYVLGGRTFSNIYADKNVSLKGLPDYWVVKLDSNGVNNQWQRDFGGYVGLFSSASLLYTVRQTLDNGYILAGNTNIGLIGDKSEASRGGNDFWVIKLNQRGAIEWQKTIGGSGDDQLFSIQQTRDLGYILAGYSNSNRSFEKAENSRGGYDFWIVKLKGSCPSDSLIQPQILNLCQGEAKRLTFSKSNYTFSWARNGQIINGATNDNLKVTSEGIYRVTAAKDGCILVDSVKVSMKVLPNPMVNDVNVCQNSPVELRTTRSFQGYQWSTGDTTAILRVTPSVNSTYSLTVTDEDGCKGTDTARVVVLPLPNPIVNNSTICKGDAAIIEVTNANPNFINYTWLPNGDNERFSDNPSVSTIYRVTVSDARGCTNTASGQVTVNSVPTPIVSNKSICFGDSVQLIVSNATIFSSIQWSTGVVAANIKVAPTESTNYIIKVTDSRGCTDTSSAWVYVKPLPTVSILNVHNTVCKNVSPITLQGQPAGGLFKIDGIFCTSLAPSFLSLGTHPIQYTYTNPNTRCSNTASQFFTIAAPTHSILDTTLCDGEFIIVNGNRYDVSNPIGNETIAGGNVQGCDSTVAVRIKKQNLPKAVNDLYKIELGVPSLTFDVTFNDDYINRASLFTVEVIREIKLGTMESTGFGHFRYSPTKLQKGIYSFTYRLCAVSCNNQIFCDSATVNIEVVGTEDRNRIPNIITPNQDGNNDEFIIPELEEDPSKYPNAELSIISRWGNVVFHDKHYKNKWNGVNQYGEALPDGAYYYCLKLNISDGKIRTGDLMIFRGE